MWLTPIERALLNLNQQISREMSAYRTREKAYEELKKLSGEDFGYDSQSWYRWYLATLKDGQLSNIHTSPTDYGCNLIIRWKRHMARRWWKGYKAQKHKDPDR